MGVLLLAPRINETGLRLLGCAGRRGLRAHTAVRWEAPAELARVRPAYLYGGPLFADAVAGALEIAPLQPSPGWLASLPWELTQRQVELTTLARARRLRRPAFVKAPLDKLFAARVHRDGSGLPGSDALDDDTPVLVSDVAVFVREYRLFVLDGAVRAASRYAVAGALAVAAELPPDAAAFAVDVLAAGGLPSGAVLDVGLLDTGAWAVVEANPAWASGGYACDTDGVLDTVLRAAGPADAVAAADLPYQRAVPEVVRDVARATGQSAR